MLTLPVHPAGVGDPLWMMWTVGAEGSGNGNEISPRTLPAPVAPKAKTPFSVFPLARVVGEAAEVALVAFVALVALVAFVALVALVALVAFVALSAVVAEGTFPRLDSRTSAPDSESFLTFAPVTALLAIFAFTTLPFLIFTDVTAFLFNCLVPTLFGASAVAAATALPLSAKNSANSAIVFWRRKRPNPLIMSYTPSR